MKQESFNFKNSWNKAIRAIPDPAIKLRYYDAVLDDVLYGIEPDDDLMEYVVTFAFSNILSDYEKYINQQVNNSPAGKQNSAKRASKKASKGKFEA